MTAKTGKIYILANYRPQQNRSTPYQIDPFKAVVWGLTFLMSFGWVFFLVRLALNAVAG